MHPETLTAVPTPFGDVVFRGDLTGRPVVLIIGGAFEGERAYSRVQSYLPGADALVAHLPGNHCPPLSDWSVTTWAKAYDAALDRHCGPPAVVVGVSTGALVALSMKAAGLVLAEPPLRPHLAWPLHLFKAQGPPDRWPFVSSVFGVYPDRIESRDYSPLLAKVGVPTIALAGGDALGEVRHFEQMPSLVDPLSLADLAAHPMVDLRVQPGVGHNIHYKAGRAFVDAINEMTTRASPGS